MRDDGPPRATCDDHGKYRAGCDGCKQAHKRWEAWRYPPVQSDGLWAVRVVGDFGKAGRMHMLPALDEVTAWRRAQWWSAYRHDVQVSVMTRGADGAWVDADELAVAA